MQYRTERNWSNYNKQRKFCINLLQKTNAKHFQKLYEKDHDRCNVERKEVTYYGEKTLPLYHSNN